MCSILVNLSCQMDSVHRVIAPATLSHVIQSLASVSTVELVQLGLTVRGVMK